MSKRKLDKTRIEPATGSEEEKPPKVYEDAAAKGGPINATTAEIPEPELWLKTRAAKKRNASWEREISTTETGVITPDAL